MVLIVALGFGAIFIKYTWLKEALKIVGAIYMLYLAWCIMQSSVADSDSRKGATPFSFTQAALFQWINPKAWLMAIGAVSLFTVIDNYYMNAAAISVVFAIVLLPCAAAWLFFGTLLQKVLAEEGHRRWFNLVMAVSLVASISLIFIE